MRGSVWANTAMLAATVCTLGFLAKEFKFHGPHMQLNSDVFDFGTLREGTMLEHTFQFLNSGNAPLEIVWTWGD